MRHRLQARIETIMDKKLHQWVGRGFSNHNAGFRFDDRPRTLLGALWLQCGLALTGQRDFYPCANPRCDQRIEIAQYKKGRKKDLRYCSTLCRATVGQERKLEVRRLGAEKLSLRTISKRTGTPIETVRKWLPARSKNSKRGPR